MDTLKRLIRSTPFRLAITFTSVALLCFTLGAVVYNYSLRSGVLDRIDTFLIQKMDAIEQSYNDDGLDSLVDFIDFQNTGLDVRIGYTIASMKDSTPMAGNVPVYAKKEGWLDIDAADMNLDSDEEYRFLSRRIDNMLVSVGRSKEILKVVTEQSLFNFLVTFAVTGLMTLLGGILLAYRTQTRVQNAATAMREVTDGNIDVRLPVSYRGDDIDRISCDMNSTLDLLQQQIVAMKSVSENIAHDLKTPLNRLFIKIDEAAVQAENGQPVAHLLEEAGNEAADINSTFEALLRIAQIEARARRAKFTMIGVVPLLDKVFEAYDAVADEKNQKLQFNSQSLLSSGSALETLGDKDLMLQLIVNLVENAIRHCPERTLITLDAGIIDEKIWISVSDNGPGIPAESSTKVFDRLYRLDTSRTDSGSGLGLSMVKAIVDLHCATIQLLDNEPGLRVHISFDTCNLDSA